MKREVSCKVVQALLQYMEERDMDILTACRDNPYPLSHLRDPNERIEWDVFCGMLRNLRQTWSDDDFEAVGLDITRHASFRSVLALGRFLFSGPEIYRWWGKSNNGPGVQMINCVTPHVLQLAQDRLLVTLDLRPGLAPCRDFYVITKGCFAAGPTVLGLPPAVVTFAEFSGGARFDVTFPQPRNRYPRLRQILSWVTSARSMAQGLEEANASLHDRYKELEDARDRITRQATQLKLAHDISQLIHADLDLDSSLQAIARSLVEIAGFAGASIDVQAETEERHIERQAMAGRLQPGTLTLIRPLEGRNGRTGEVTLSLAPGIDPAYAAELLEYIVPTISMEIDNAISYTILNELHANLEQKVQDRTHELQETNAALKRAQAGRDRLFANISHELRTPLTLIVGPLETMYEQSPAGADRERLVLMKKHADRLLSLINQMLELARLESGDILVRPVPVELAPFLRGITMSYRSLAATRHMDLCFHEFPDRIILSLDRDKAEMLFNNLLMNAFKFTPDGGRIDVRMWTDDETANISVTDTGPGIPEADLPYIFDRFYQGEAADRHPTGGTGIGLSLAKELAGLHGGSTRVSSTEGTGSVFTVSLPLLERIPGMGISTARDERAAAERTGEENRSGIVRSPGRPLHGPKRRVLIVDDDADVRSYIRDILGTAMAVTEAVDGRDGIARARDLMPDLIICDVMMPQCNGYEVCRMVKEDVRTSHIPIILLTARAGTESRIEGLETGADDFIVKPFVARELRARVTNLIAGRATLHAKFVAERRFRPEVLQLPSREETFLQNAIDVAARHLPDEHFTIEELSREIGLSRAQLHRKLVSLTGCSARDFLRRLRLERAHDLLLADSGTVSEIAFQVGFSDPSHFARCFRRHYGVAPGAARTNSTAVPAGQ